MSRTDFDYIYHVISLGKLINVLNGETPLGRRILRVLDDSDVFGNSNLILI